MVRPNIDRFVESLGVQLSYGATRVRDLIGDRHWGVDGSHKEAIFRAFVEPHLPTGIVCKRGFVLGHNHSLTSTEQDVLIVDTSVRAPVLTEHDLVLTVPESVIGSISVKTRMDGAEIEDAIAGLSTVLRSCARPWLGAFFFDDRYPASLSPSKLYEHVHCAIVRDTPGERPLDAELGDGVEMLADMHSTCLVLDHSVTGVTSVSGYDCAGKAPAVFLARLLAHIAALRGANSWMSSALDRMAMTPLVPSSQTWNIGAMPRSSRAAKRSRKRKPKRAETK